jgi:hypothetical protein
VKPVIAQLRSILVGVNDVSCHIGTGTTNINATITDATDPAAQLRVSGTWSFSGRSGAMTMRLASSNSWQGTLSPFNAKPTQDTPITVTVTAFDPAGNTASRSITVTYFGDCPIIS